MTKVRLFTLAIHTSQVRRISASARGRPCLSTPMPRGARLLAYGDSLTAGYCQMGRAFKPWAPLLCKLLGCALVDHTGLSGWRTSQMVQALDAPDVADVSDRHWPGLRHQLRHARAPYDVVVIMAGTNDLADRDSPASIVESIARLHEAAHKAGAATVALPIPDSHSEMTTPWHSKLRRDTNSKLREWALAQPTGRVLYVDSTGFCPFTEKTMDTLWEQDGLHMSELGYQTFGKQLAPAIAPFVAASVAARLPSARSAFVEGAAVRIHGLVNAAEHNGKRGRLGKGPNLGASGGGSDRVGVHLGDGQWLAVRRRNLEPLPPTEAEPPAEPDYSPNYE